MKNIIDAKPSSDLHGRVLYNTIFVADKDIKGRDILDIGCGYGWFELNALSRKCNKTVGIELTKEDLSTAKKYVKHHKIEFKQGSAISLPFNKKTFDTVVSWEVIEHIPQNTENTMFKEVSRVLKKGGSFYLSTPFNTFFSNICDPAWWLIGHRHYKKEQLIDYAENNGFRVEKLILNGGWWEIYSINNLYVAKWIFRRKPFFEHFFNFKLDEEYKKKTGFTNIFINFRKV